MNSVNLALLCDPLLGRYAGESFRVGDDQKKLRAIKIDLKALSFVFT